MLPRPVLSSIEGFICKQPGSYQREYIADVLVVVPSLLQTKGINVEGWPVVCVGVEIRPTVKLDWVFADEPARARIEIAEPRKLELSLGIPLTGRVLEGIRQRAARSCGASKRIVGVGLGQRTSRVA